MRAIFKLLLSLTFLSFLDADGLSIPADRQAALVQRIIEHTNLPAGQTRILVTPSLLPKWESVVDCLNEQMKSTREAGELVIAAKLLDETLVKSSDVVVLANASDSIVEGVLNIAFNLKQVERGAVIGVVKVRDRLVLYINAGAAKKLGVVFDLQLLKLAQIIKGGNL